MKLLLAVACYKRAARTLEVWCRHCLRTVGSTAGGSIVFAADGEAALLAASPYHALGVGIIGSKKRVGVARNKNRIFRFFLEHKEYEHLFLFEDDVWPIKEGWIEFYLDHHRLGQTECLLFLPPGMYGKVLWNRILPGGKALLGYEHDGGMVLSLTRRAVETCGGFHGAFDAALYGGEHSELVRRLTRNGLMPFTHLTPKGCEQFFDSWDWSNFQGKVNQSPGYAEWLRDLAARSPHVRDLPRGESRRLAEQGLAIFDRVKDDGSVFHDPRR